MPKLTSPASRLLDFIEKVKSLDEKTLRRPMYEVLPRVFGTKQNDRVGLHRKLSLLGQLPHEVVNDFKAIPNLDHDLHLSWVSAVHTAMNPLNLEKHIIEMVSVFNNEVVNLIKICDSHLIRVKYGFEIDQDRLDELQNQAEALAKDIAQDDSLDDGQKDYLLYHTSLVIQAINDYRLRGTTAIIEAVEASVGAALLRGKHMTGHVKTKYGDRLKKLLAGIVLVSGAYQGVKEIAKDVASNVPAIVDIIQQCEGQ